MTGKPILRVNLGTYPATEALKSGTVSSALLDIEFSPMQAVWDEFAVMVRELKYDISEMSLVSFLQAKAHGRPLVLLPLVITGWVQHGHIGYNSERGEIRAADLNGRRVGVRSYPQTSGTWARAILEEEHGVDLSSIQWTCVEEPHVPQYRDPPNVTYDRTGRTLADLLREGELDAAILGPDMHRDTRFRPVIADADDAITRWKARQGITQIVHMPVVTEALSRERPDLVREFFRLCLASRRAAPADRRAAFAEHPAGLDRVRHGIGLMIDICLRQGLLPRALTVDELFDETTAALGRG